jgi:hypothetical protein
MEASMKRDATSARLAKEIAEAREALIETARLDPERWWFAYELKDQARNGWSAGAMNMALRRMIDAEIFELDGDRIRLHR